MRIKGSDLRRIIKEEIARSVRSSSRKIIMEEVSRVSVEELAGAEDAFNRTYSPGGAYARSPFSRYKSAWGNATKGIKTMAGWLPDYSLTNTSQISEKAISGIEELGSLGSRHPLAQELMDIVDSDAPDTTKARMIFVTLAGGEIGNSRDRAGSNYIGLDDPAGAPNRAKFDEKNMYNAPRFVVPNVRMLASTDIIAEYNKLMM